MMHTSTDNRERRLSQSEDGDEITAWIKRHAPLTELCQMGGWPDDTRLKVEMCSSTSREWIINIFFIETIMEISECDVTERERCGQFAVNIDEAGHPTDIRMIQAL